MVGNHIDCRVLALLTSEHLPKLAERLHDLDVTVQVRIGYRVHGTGYRVQGTGYMYLDVGARAKVDESWPARDSGGSGMVTDVETSSAHTTTTTTTTTTTGSLTPALPPHPNPPPNSY